LDAYYDQATADVTRGIASMGYIVPDFQHTGHILTEDVRYQKFDLSTQEFDLDRVSLSSYLFRNWEGNVTNTFGHTIFQEYLDNVTPGAIIGPDDTGDVVLSFLSGGLTYDQRDSALSATEGYRIAFDYALASQAIGSDADYFSFASKGQKLFPFHLGQHQFQFALRSKLAGSWTYGDTDVIPISQRYYLGGRTSVRGFRENSLGPRALDGAVIGGDTLFLASSELSYFFTDTLSLLSFFDAGNVYLMDDDFDLGNTRESIGLGLRYSSPIGPIGIDLGHPLDEREGEPSVRLHFVIGNQF
jgi:outer membrane protein insertion porin family